MIGLQTWHSKIRSKNWEKLSFVFFLFETKCCHLKLKLPFVSFIDTWKTENSVEEKDPSTDENVMIKLVIGLKISKTYTLYVYFNFFLLNIS